VKEPALVTAEFLSGCNILLVFHHAQLGSFGSLILFDTLYIDNQNKNIYLNLFFLNNKSNRLSQ
ncbi:hypothetical protein, partial [Xenorhabdus khoisanae]|uniref:hypothetical protein n=1 Tax=Xenorhabdus khoisanae TaxID=880157 RepID=UPI001F178C02